MLCNSNDVESVVRLSDKVDGHIDIKLDVEDLGLKAKGATYPEIKAYVKDKYGLNVSSLYIAQVKGKLGIKERKNYNVGADKTVIPNCPPEKAEAIMDAFRHFNMV